MRNGRQVGTGSSKDCPPDMTVYHFGTQVHFFVCCVHVCVHVCAHVCVRVPLPVRVRAMVRDGGGFGAKRRVDGGGPAGGRGDGEGRWGWGGGWGTCA